MRSVFGVCMAVGTTVGCGADSLPQTLDLVGEQMAYHVQITPESSPLLAGDVTLDVTLMDHETMAGVEGASLTVEPWMTAHDHGVEGTPTVSDDGGGDYTVGFAFSMPGAWEVRIDIDGESGPDRVVAEFEVE